MLKNLGLKPLLYKAFGQPMQSDMPDSVVKRISWQNIRLLSLALFVSLLLTSLLVGYFARHHQLDNLKISSEILANSLVTSLVFTDQQQAELEFTAFSNRKDLMALQLFTRQGELFSQWRRSSTTMGSLSTPEVLLQREIAVKVEYFHFTLGIPLWLDNEQIGMLWVQESFFSLHRSLIVLISLMGLITLSTMLLASHRMTFMQKRLLSPLIELSALAEYAAQHQDFSRRSVIYRRDEVGRLAERINELFQQVALHQADLQKQLLQQTNAGEQLRQLAHHDSLTGLPNRLFFQQHCDFLVEQAIKTGRPMALMFIDLDNFKTVNDQWGHDFGDEVLVTVGQRMRHILRTEDQVCRLGGDEFAVLIPTVSTEESVEVLADRLIKTIREPMFIQSELMPVGATVGIAFCPQDADSSAALLQKADEAMYLAKKAGKNTFRRVPYAS